MKKAKTIKPNYMMIAIAVIVIVIVLYGIWKYFSSSKTETDLNDVTETGLSENYTYSVPKNELLKDPITFKTDDNKEFTIKVTNEYIFKKNIYGHDIPIIKGKFPNTTSFVLVPFARDAKLISHVRCKTTENVLQGFIPLASYNDGRHWRTFKETKTREYALIIRTSVSSGYSGDYLYVLFDERRLTGRGKFKVSHTTGYYDYRKACKAVTDIHAVYKAGVSIDLAENLFLFDDTFKGQFTICSQLKNVLQNSDDCGNTNELPNPYVDGLALVYTAKTCDNNTHTHAKINNIAFKFISNASIRETLKVDKKVDEIVGKIEAEEAEEEEREERERSEARSKRISDGVNSWFQNWSESDSAKEFVNTLIKETCTNPDIRKPVHKEVCTQNGYTYEYICNDDDLKKKFTDKCEEIGM